MLFILLASIEDPESKSYFEYIYFKYEEFIFKTAYEMTDDISDAEAVSIKVFCSIARNIKKISSLGKGEKPYIFTIVKNASTDLLRKKGKAKIKTRNMDGFRAPINLMKNAENSESYKNLVNRILNLPEIYRDVLYLRYVADMKKTMIAKVLNRKVKTVDTQLRRGKQMLEKILEEENCND